MRLFGQTAAYEIDFDGRLSHAAEVRIETNLSGVEITVPGSTAAEIVADTTLGTVDVGDGFTKREGAFLTEAGVAKGKPLLRIHAEARLGALEIRST